MIYVCESLRLADEAKILFRCVMVLNQKIILLFFFKQMPRGKFYSSLENKVLRQQKEGEWSVLPMVVVKYSMFWYIVENLFLDYNLENLIL